MAKKFQFVMNERLAETLETLKTKTGRESYAEVLRDALRTYLWMVEQYEHGNEVLTRPRDPNTFTPLIPPAANAPAR